MTVETAIFPKAFGVSFHQLDRWDPSSFQPIDWHWPESVMAPIGSFLTPRKEKVDRKKRKFKDLQPITIHFDGSIDKRQVDDGREYTMELFAAMPGDIVVAKIDLKNGAVAIIPDDWHNCVVTGHFAVYAPDLKKIVPEYFHRIIQTSFFKAHLWRNKVGAEGRKEVKLDFFESQLIPLPTIDVQRSILHEWNAVQKKIGEAYKRADAKRLDVFARFLSDLGLTLPDESQLPTVFAVPWFDFRRWGVGFNQLRLAGMDITEGRYQPVPLGSMLNMVQYGTSTKANTAGKGTPIIRMNNIKDGRIDISDLKHIELPASERAGLILKNGDILINRTNSKELVGKCAVFDKPGDYVFASYLIRLRVDPEMDDPWFVAFLINSPIGRQQVDMVSRQIIGQANINTEEIRSFDIPRPTLTEQKKIMDRVQRNMADVDKVIAEADEVAKQAKADIEELILGRKNFRH